MSPAATTVVRPGEPGAPAVSLVAPLFNGLALSRAMLESLRATLPPGLPHEVILVDDASSDGTRPWLQTLGGACRIVLNERNLGFGASCNRGAALARGRLLVLLNNDLVLRPGWLQPMMDAHAALAGRAGVIGNVQRRVDTGAVDHAGVGIDEKGKPAHLRTGARGPARLICPIRAVPAVTGACMLLDLDLWRRLGGFDEAYRNGCEDIDLCLRAGDAGRVNAVALRSAVLHHVSASPGRKAGDEANTRLLFERWRPQLALLGRRAWVRDWFTHLLPDPRDFPSAPEAWGAALYLLGIVRRPPARALPGMHAALDRELARWKVLLDGQIDGLGAEIKGP